MARKHIGRAVRGSQYHLQNLVNEFPVKLGSSILSNNSSLFAYATELPKWISPLACQNYCEYRDGNFLQALGLDHLRANLSILWPRFGPSWDALATVAGKNGGTGVILLEAKTHFKELGIPSYACGAKGESLKKIKASLANVKRVLSVSEDSDWLGKNYQYANRLAHLLWLNGKGIPTWMVFLYFTGDREQRGPGTDFEWKHKLNEMRIELGLPQHHILSERIIDIFMPVS